MTSRPQQSALPDTLVGGRDPIYCTICRRELHDPVSRARRMGPECDPLNQPRTRDHDVDQDTIPGT
ncbi:DUF6011 domain-containing protein [Streptomyces platensis]|uniref:DUF6011 domain-containing protein n=1 Tax=Streptomyces platensis TaxID=58346 RepID=UPI003318B751